MSDQMLCPDLGQMHALLAGILPTDAQEEIGRHVEACESCQQTLERLARSSWEGKVRNLEPDEVGREPALQEVVERVRRRAEPAETEGGALGEQGQSLPFLDPAKDPSHLGRLGHYEILELVGKGGFGIVLKAFDEKLHRMVAIKVMAPELAASGTSRKRFVREAQAAAAVKNDHIIAIHAVEDEHQPPYFVMELIDGISLQQRLDQEGALDLKEILRIGLQIAEGLAPAHKQGLVHRDIKPANILLENGVQRVKITDFGLARAVDDASVTRSGVIAGTPQYMSPEQATAEHLDHRSDLFSLGTLLYAMCTGRPPFRASSTVAILKRVCEETPRPIREINNEVPDWLVDIITRLHAKKPAERFQSAREVADLLGQHLAELQVRGKSGSTPATRSSREGQGPAGHRSHENQPHRRLPKAIWLAAAGVLLLVGVAAALLFRGRGVREVQPPDKGSAEEKKLPIVLARFGPGDSPLVKDAVAEGGGWRFHFDKPGDYKLFEIPVPPGEPGRYTCRLEIKSANVQGWFGLTCGSIHQGDEHRYSFAWTGAKDSEWSSRQASCVFLRPKEQPETLFLGIQMLQTGTVWVRDVQFLHEKMTTPDQRIEIAAAREIQVEPRGMKVLNGHLAWADLSPDGQTLALVGEMHKLRFWHQEGNEWQAGQALHTFAFVVPRFSPDGSALTIIGPSTPNLFLKEKGQWNQGPALADGPSPSRSQAYTPDGKAVFVAFFSPGAMQAYRLPRGTLLERVQINPTEFRFKDSGQDYARAVRDEKMGVWRIEVGGQEMFAVDHARATSGVAWSRDGETLATVQFSGLHTLWKKRQGEWQRHASWQTATQVNCLALGVRDRVLASAHYNGTCQLWDMATGQELATLRGHKDKVLTMVFGPDDTLITSAADGHVGFWKIKLLKAPAKPSPR